MCPPNWPHSLSVPGRPPTTNTWILWKPATRNVITCTAEVSQYANVHYFLSINILFRGQTVLEMGHRLKIPCALTVFHEHGVEQLSNPIVQFVRGQSIGRQEIDASAKRLTHGTRHFTRTAGTCHETWIKRKGHCRIVDVRVIIRVTTVSLIISAASVPIKPKPTFFLWEDLYRQQQDLTRQNKKAKCAVCPYQADVTCILSTFKLLSSNMYNNRQYPTWYLDVGLLYRLSINLCVPIDILGIYWVRALWDTSTAWQHVHCTWRHLIKRCICAT